LVLALAITAGIVLTTLESLGAPTERRSCGRASERSPEYQDGEFVNATPTQSLEPGSFGEMLRHQFFGKEQREPAGPIRTEPREWQDYQQAPASGLRTTWMGHSTVLVEIDGARILLDPIWSDRCSPVRSRDRAASSRHRSRSKRYRRSTPCSSRTITTTTSTCRP
jgi:hypothetical protein